MTLIYPLSHGKKAVISSFDMQASFFRVIFFLKKALSSKKRVHFSSSIHFSINGRLGFFARSKKWKYIKYSEQIFVRTVWHHFFLLFQQQKFDWEPVTRCWLYGETSTKKVIKYNILSFLKNDGASCMDYLARKIKEKVFDKCISFQTFGNEYLKKCLIFAINFLVLDSRTYQEGSAAIQWAMRSLNLG